MTPTEMALQFVSLLEMSHTQHGEQIAALKTFVQGLQAQAAKTARIELPAFCEGIPDKMCALRNEDARIEKPSLSHPHRFMCRGCGAASEDGITVTK